MTVYVHEIEYNRRKFRKLQKDRVKVNGKKSRR